MNKININLKFTIAHLFVILSFFSVWAVVSGDSTLLLSNDTVLFIKSLIVYITLIFIVLIFILSNGAFLKFSINNVILAISPFVYYGITHIFNFSGKESILIINAITIALFCVIKDEIKSLVYIEVKKLLVISAWISILFYVIDLFNIPCWGSSVNYYIDNLGTYRDYYVTSFVHIGSFIRACGFFNEPGFYGTIIALFLVIDGINLKKLDNVIILIAGVLTFSAAFYILLIGYAILKLVISKPVLGVFALFIFIFVIYFLNNLYYSYSDNSIFWRIIGIITGKQNNRSYDTINDMVYRTLHSEYWLFGHGYGYVESIISDLSIKKYIVDFGIGGCALMFSPIFYPIIKESKKLLDARISFIIFVLSIYQRPNIFVLLYFVIITGIYNKNKVCIDNKGIYKKERN